MTQEKNASDIKTAWSPHAQELTPSIENTTNEAEKPEGIKTLEFKTHGWCEELKCSYSPGTYMAKDAKEYDALKKYAEKG